MGSMLALKGAFALKAISAVVGAALVVLSLSYFVNEFGYLEATGFPGLADIIIIISILIALLSGIMLLTELPNSLRVRFRRTFSKRKPNEVYGFGTIFAIGLGATLGISTLYPDTSERPSIPNSICRVVDNRGYSLSIDGEDLFEKLCDHKER